MGYGWVMSETHTTRTEATHETGADAEDVAVDLVGQFFADPARRGVAHRIIAADVDVAGQVVVTVHGGQMLAVVLVDGDGESSLLVPSDWDCDDATLPDDDDPTWWTGPVPMLDLVTAGWAKILLERSGVARDVADTAVSRRVSRPLMWQLAQSTVNPYPNVLTVDEYEELEVSLRAAVSVLGES